MDKQQPLKRSKQVAFDLPSSGPSDSAMPEETPERKTKAGRAGLTRNACNRCRMRKSKCNGQRNVCGRCERDGAECTYDVPEEGMTRMQSVQQQLDTKTSEQNKMAALFNALQYESDFNASTLLARLRLGADVDDLLSSLGALRYADAESQSPLLNADLATNGQLQSSPWYMQTWRPSPIDEQLQLP